MIGSAVDFTSLVWSSCGAHRPLNLGTQVALTSTSPNASGLTTDDTIDGKSNASLESSGVSAEMSEKKFERGRWSWTLT